jgi:phosphoglycerol transferase MdoB-like AlkP superfamily enzyme
LRAAVALALPPKRIGPIARLRAPGMAWALATLIASATAIYVGRTEGGPANVLFTLAVIGTVAASVTLIARRILLATFIVAVWVALLGAIAQLKQQTTDVALHAYDAVSLLTSWTALSHLWHNHGRYVVAVLAALMVTAVLGWTAYKLDGSRVRRHRAFVAVLIFASLVWIGADAREARRHMGFYYEDRHLWFFFSSWLETAEALWRGHLIDAADQHLSPALNLPASCNPASKPPHIILIHQESVVPPSYFPSLSYDRNIDAFFHSHDGKVHKLRVETYGGASWLTEFSVLTGLSAFSLGHLRQFAQTIMGGKVRETLPQVLARCGYRNIAFHPMLRIYLSIEKFLKSVGMHQMFDAKDQGAKSATERDRFYYSSALTEMEHHFKMSGQPLFTFIETMATHGPYSYAYMPEVAVSGGGPGTDPAMHEYLRRLSMAGVDYDFLRAEIARRFPEQSFLIVHYGDHHPTATRPLLGFGQEADIEHVLRSGNTAALVTYYAVDAVRYQPPPLPSLETLDVPYLPNVILAAAGLPLSDVYRERLRLMTLCEGRYHGCPEIAGFHRRLIDSGIIDAW